MKKVLSVLVAVLLMVVACVPAFAATYSADLEASKTTAAVGEEIVVSFKVSSGIAGLKATVDYNSDCYEYVEGSATSNDLFTTTVINDTVDGKITVACASDSAVDAGLVFTAKFKVLKADDASFEATVTDAVDGDNEQITVGGDVLTITVTGESTTAADNGDNSGEGSDGSDAAGNTNSGNSIDSPKTGGKLYVCAASAVAVCAAAVAVSMKKKNEE